MTQLSVVKAIDRFGTASDTRNPILKMTSPKASPGTRLRHGAASEMINAGIDLFTVGGVPGHKSVVLTKRYSHLVTNRLAAAVGKIGQKRKEPGNSG